MTAENIARLPADALRARGAPRVRPLLRRAPLRRPGDRLRGRLRADAAALDLAAQRHELSPQPAAAGRLLPDEGRGRQDRPRPSSSASSAPATSSSTTTSRPSRRSSGWRSSRPVRSRTSSSRWCILFGGRAGVRGPGRPADDHVYQLLPNYPADRAGMHARRPDRLDRRPRDAGRQRARRHDQPSLGKPLHVVYQHAGRDCTVDVDADRRARRQAGRAPGLLSRCPRCTGRRRRGLADSLGPSSPASSAATLGVLGSLVTHPAHGRRSGARADRHGAGLRAGAAVRAVDLPVARGDDLDLAGDLQPAADPGDRRRARASSSWSRCCAAGRSIPKRKRSCTSAASRC